LASSSARFSVPDVPKRSEILTGIVRGTIVVDAGARLKTIQIIGELKKLVNNADKATC
jgi:hypothetical protein